MLIQCPSCGLQAKLPDSKEGAKVRCSECERVYIAKPAGARGRSSQKKSNLPIIIGASVVVLVIILFGVMGGGPNNNAPVTDVVIKDVSAKEKYVDPTGWDSPLLKTARRIHELAYTRNTLDLQGLIDVSHAWAEANGSDDGPADPAAYESLTSAERSAFIDSVIGSLIADGDDNLVGSWEPMDGLVIQQEDEFATVQVELVPRDAGKSGTRGIHWQLIKVNGKWKAWKWERWISDAEAAANIRRSSKKTAKKTLSDGSLVLESEPRILPHDPTTSPELAARIDELIALLGDPNLPPRTLTPAREELQAIGKPATPKLITAMWQAYEAGMDEYDNQIKVSSYAKMLKDITGYSTTVALEAMGGTQERLDSGMKQWFYWYDRKYKRFKGIDEAKLTDGLEAITDMDDLSERERRDYEKAKREQEQDND